MPNERNNKQRTLRGIVVSDAMEKTIVVEVRRAVWHPKYRKQYRTTKRYKVHDEGNEYHVGEVVDIIASRPISREKRWRVRRKGTTA